MNTCNLKGKRRSTHSENNTAICEPVSAFRIASKSNPSSILRGSSLAPQLSTTL
jgi:hypothetical protein